ncbi:MAG: fibronectin type III domain-containing protein [Thermodesulfovibrionales bacterium]|nr:fibronectin type III domain-containing protein [Thermodesulfovibrionales bacterium]
MIKKIKWICLLQLLFLSIILFISCGKKTAPTLKSYEPPKPVQSLISERIEEDLHITWTYPTQDLKLLKYFILTIKSDEGEEIFTLPPESSLYKYTKVKESSVYTYSIKAINKKDRESPTSYQKAIICKLPKEKPQLRYEIKGDFLLLTWNPLKIQAQMEDCSKEVFYNIYHFDKTTNQIGFPINDKPIRQNQIEIPIETNKTTYFTIRPIVEAKTLNIGQMADPVKITPELFIPSPPKILSTHKSNNRVFIMWNEAKESWVKGYRVYKRGQDFKFKQVAEVLTPVFTEELDEDKPAYYMITAIGPISESKPSEILELK